jgi:hypothetical protein
MLSAKQRIDLERLMLTHTCIADESSRKQSIQALEGVLAKQVDSSVCFVRCADIPTDPEPFLKAVADVISKGDVQGWHSVGSTSFWYHKGASCGDISKFNVHASVGEIFFHHYPKPANE